MEYEVCDVVETEAEMLANLRVASMKESLKSIGRFEPERAKKRFLDTFSHVNTKKVLVNNMLAGFYVLTRENTSIYINHLYIHPFYQGNKIGSSVLMSIKRHANDNSLVLRVGALRGSKANNFYLSHGFIYTHEEEWDIYYEYNSANKSFQADR